MAPVLLFACVSQSTYDQLQAQYQQAQQKNAALSNQVAADKAQICRLQGAIKYTVNSDQLYPSGGYQMSERGKQIIAGFADWFRLRDRCGRHPAPCSPYYKPAGDLDRHQANSFLREW